MTSKIVPTICDCLNRVPLSKAFSSLPVETVIAGDDLANIVASASQCSALTCVADTSINEMEFSWFSPFSGKYVAITW